MGLPKPKMYCTKETILWGGEKGMCSAVTHLRLLSTRAQWMYILMYILAADVATALLWWLTEHCCQISALHCFSLSAFSISSLL